MRAIQLFLSERLSTPDLSLRYHVPLNVYGESLIFGAEKVVRQGLSASLKLNNSIPRGSPIL